MLEAFTEQLTRSQSLTDDEVNQAVGELVNETVSPESKAAFLTALARKGESPGEIAAFARALRARSIQPNLDGPLREAEILDVCGTGGDRLNTFNISTTVALVLAAAGVFVAKHGNRAITSQAGSADVLEALGIRIDLTPEQAVASLREQHFAFFFAPNYHPAFRHIAPARKLCAERGQRTIFNLLGPLLNPARPTAQLVGVPRPQWCEPIAQVLQALGVRRGLVVCGAVGENFLDEFSTLGVNTVAEFYQDRGFATCAMGVNSFPLQPARLADLEGGDRHANAAIVRAILVGHERGPKRDAVLLNAAAALMVVGQTKTMSEGWERAGELIDSGAAQRKLAALAVVTG